MRTVKALALCLLAVLAGSCEWAAPARGTGHREIAEAVRSLLDEAYAGADYARYHQALQEVEAVAARNLPETPHTLRAAVERMLGYLQTADEVLRWRSEGGPGADTGPVAAWTERYPVLRAAAPENGGGFDAGTALMLLWDAADRELRDLQIKRGPP